MPYIWRIYVSASMDEVLSKAAKKVVKWGEGKVVFITRECKELSWDTNTLVRVSVVKGKGKKKLVIEEIGRV